MAFAQMDNAIAPCSARHMAGASMPATLPLPFFFSLFSGVFRPAFPCRANTCPADTKSL